MKKVTGGVVKNKFFPNWNLQYFPLLKKHSWAIAEKAWKIERNHDASGQLIYYMYTLCNLYKMLNLIRQRPEFYFQNIMVNDNIIKVNRNIMFYIKHLTQNDSTKELHPFRIH